MHYNNTKNYYSKTPTVNTGNRNFPKISVEMGCYNFEKYIDEAIKSVLAQTLKPYELIISDDHSTDRSWEIIQSYKKKHPELIRSFRTPENVGMKQCGIMRKDMVRGDFLSTIDGDDRWLPRKLELEWEAFKKYPEAKLAYSNVFIIDELGERTSIWYDGDGDPPPSGDVFVQTFAKKFFKNNRSVFRSHLMYYDVLKEIGYKDLDDNLMHPDWDKKIRMTARYKVAYSDHAMVEYRVHSNGIHKTQAEDLFKSTEYVIQKNMHLLKSRSPEEQQFVLENLKTLLIQDYNYGRKKKSENAKSRKNNKPRKVMSYKGQNLVFIISQPRAGSTLVQRILSGHQDIHTTAEPWIMLHPLYALKEKGVFSEFDSNQARQGLEDFTSQVPEGNRLYIEALRQMGDILYNRVLEVSGKRIFIDKTPRYYFIIPELKKVFPEAKFVILLRNPLAVLSSTLKTWFQNNHENLQRSQNYLDVIKGPLYLIQGIQLLKEDAIVVKYEELVEDAETCIKALCKELGISFQQEMLTYGVNPKPKGRFGDAVGIVKHDNAVPYYQNIWIKNLQLSELYEFSLKYMEALGPEVFNLMGYSYQENKGKLKKSQNYVKSKDKIKEETSCLQSTGSYEYQRIEDPITILETKLKQDPFSAQYHNDLGFLFYNSGEKDKALQSYRRAVEIQPENVNFRKNLADFYYAVLGRIGDAIEHYCKIIETNPEDIEILLILGHISVVIKKFQNAKVFYNKVLELNPFNQDAKQKLNNLSNIDNSIYISKSA